MDKVRFYLAHGVRLVWLIDPDRRTVTVLAPPDVIRILTEEESLDGGEVLPGFRLPIATLFAQDA